VREAQELNSMDFLNLVFAVSKRSQVVIPEADYAKVLTLSAMISYMMKHA
jgi:acyl carrier protein